MAETLIERWEKYRGNWQSQDLFSWCYEAAAALKAAEAELEKTRIGAVENGCTAVQAIANLAVAQDTLKAAEEELRRKTEALTDIAKQRLSTEGEELGDYQDGYDLCVQAARAALQENA